MLSGKELCFSKIKIEVLFVLCAPRARTDYLIESKSGDIKSRCLVEQPLNPLRKSWLVSGISSALHIPLSVNLVDLAFLMTQVQIAVAISSAS